MSIGRLVLQVSLPLAIIGGAVGGAVMLKQFAPQPAEQAVEPPKAQLVDVTTLAQQDHPFTIRSQGTVTPLTQTVLTSEVNGRVIKVAPAFVRGGLVKQGEILVEVERGDYESALRSAEASMARAEAALTEELARGRVAAKEWEKLGLNKATDLALRKPQLAREQANVKAAKADLERARRDYERTQIRAPYDALVRARDAEIGQFLSRGARIGELANVSTAEVRLPLTRAEQQQLNLPSLGVEASNSNLPGVSLSMQLGSQRATWQGVIKRSENVIDESNRMTYVVAQVRDPYGLQQVRNVALQFGSFVEAEIQAPQLEQVVRVPRELLRADGKLVLVNDTRELELRHVSALRQDESFVYVRDGLDGGEQLVLTPLDNPFNGMPVQLALAEGDTVRE